MLYFFKLFPQIEKSIKLSHSLLQQESISMKLGSEVQPIDSNVDIACLQVSDEPNIAHVVVGGTPLKFGQSFKWWEMYQMN